MKFLSFLGWTSLLWGLIAMIYTIYHDVLWDRYEGWINFGWKSHLAVALSAVAIIAGGKLIAMGARRGSA